jgi:hypothetical protein
MSDDQIAVLGSFAALAFCGILMALSYHFGGAAEQERQQRGAKRGAGELPSERKSGAEADRRAA